LTGQLACKHSRELNDIDNFDRFFFFENRHYGRGATLAIFLSDPM
jgi:hypothetical protein